MTTITKTKPAKTKAPRKAATKPASQTGGGIITAKYRDRYGRAGNCGDDVAAAFKEAMADGVSLDDVMAANGITSGRWAGLSAGQRRMNLSNVIRGKRRRGETVVIGNTTLAPVADSPPADSPAADSLAEA